MNDKELLSRVKTFYNGEASYGDPAMKILEGVTPESAMKRPEKKMHNAAELLAHIIGWGDVYLKRFQGNRDAMIDQNLSFDWKRIDKDEKNAWQSLLFTYEKNRDQLVSFLGQENYDVQAKEKLVNDIMEHNIYHLGQVELIKKIIS